VRERDDLGSGWVRDLLKPYSIRLIAARCPGTRAADVVSAQVRHGALERHEDDSVSGAPWAV
jgi:hypothetical protein